MNTECLEKIREHGVLPVLSVPSLAVADPLASALIAGGVSCIEVTLRSACALEAIAAIRRSHPEMSIAAGTVLSSEQAIAARKAGADMLVSPGFDPDVLEVARELDIPYVPGVTNPTEITVAFKAGLKMLKFFPAEIMGGPAALKLYHGPFPDVEFLPTGGLGFENIGNYLSCLFVAACGGSWMAKRALIDAEDWDSVSAGVRRSVEIAKAAREGKVK